MLPFSRSRQVRALHEIIRAISTLSHDCRAAMYTPFFIWPYEKQAPPHACPNSFSWNSSPGPVPSRKDVKEPFLQAGR